MRDDDNQPPGEWFIDAVAAALASSAGWLGVVLGTFVAGFYAGYCVGHRRLVSPDEAGRAFTMLPMFAMGQWPLLVAFGVMWVVWYLPQRVESVWWKLAAAGVNFVMWVVVIAYVVERTAEGKFLRF